MSAAQKASNAELVSIYRLEFYKKQNNWKYYSQERKREEERRKAAKNAKSKLNLTYNVDPGPERDTEPAEKKQVVEEETEEPNDAEVLSDERGDNLNEAFVDTGTDENATPPIQLDPPNSPYSPRWSIEHWAAQCKAHFPEPTYPSDTYPQTFPSTTYPHTYEGVYVTEATQEQIPKYADLPPLRTDLPPLRTELPPYGSVRGAGWPAASQVWVNRQEQGWFEADIPEEVEEAMEAKEALDALDAPDVLDGAEWALLDRADDWLSASSGKSSPRGCASLPSVSSGSFARGAALAPHSTELDLSDESVRAARLSAAALSAGIARHAGALRGLLAEARRRERQASTSPVEPIYSFDEYPTRDVGPASNRCRPPASDVITTGSFRNSDVITTGSFRNSDVIITGSFRNSPDLRGQTGAGRGRGTRAQLIGIGMGRPYRL